MEKKNIEYKIDIPEKSSQLKAEIVSFLNTEGGEIYLGMSDKGEADEDKIKEKKKIWEETISNWIVNAFNTNISELVEVFPDEIPFKIKISKGLNKPYYYKDGEGFNYKGIFVRVGSTKRRATQEEIKRMLNNFKTQSYESITISKKDLTFDYLEKKFKEKNIKFDKRALSLIDKNNNYNNAALLLSDQNNTITKFAIFKGVDIDEFLDKKEFSGSIVKQMDDVLYFSNLLNKNNITISGKPAREEKHDIPKRALREAIANSFCHRDYSLSGDIKVEFFKDRVQIFSPGDTPEGLTLEEMKKGFIAKRNEIIVKVLDKLGLIENYASGVRRIFQDYENFEKSPEYYISNNGVLVTLYNRNYNSNAKDVEDIIKNIIETRLTERQTKILNLIHENPKISINQIKNILNTSYSTIKREISQLKQKNKIIRVGDLKNGYWKLLEDAENE